VSTKGATRRDLLSDATRRLMLHAARRVFARRGFADASLGEIVAAAKVTTGAVYHHFRDKKGLFRAVAESVEQDILQGVMAASATVQDPWSRLLRGVDAMLEICAAPDVQRIVFIDAPTVIGPVAWREVEMRFAFGAMTRALDGLAAAGVIRAGSPQVLASILLGALIEAANSVAR
jgi:AcrR family transcriptional regulator